jgi:hypothetical protein
MKFILTIFGYIIFIFVFLILISLKFLWISIKFLWKFTPWERAKRIRELERQDQEEREYNKYIETLKTGWIKRMNPLVFIDGEIKYIYVYTTETEKVFNRYKIGETKKSPYDRIQEQDTTSNSGQLILIAYWHAGKASDKQIHKILEDLGYVRIRKNREWFIIEDPITIIPKLIEKANT